MAEQPLTISTNINTLSRLPRNGKSNKNYPLTEENLKLHTGMVPSSRETKTHFVLIYVDLQKQLVALEAQLRKESEEAQKKFNASLPENTPPVIAEVIQMPLLSNSSSPNSPTSPTSPTSIVIDDEEPTSSSFPTNEFIYSDPEPITPKSIEEIPSLLDSVIKNGRKSQRIKNLFIRTAKKITSIRNSSNVNNNNLADSSSTTRDLASLRVELSVPPSPMSTIKSRNSLSQHKVPFKNIFIHSSHNRTNSGDTMSINPTSPSSSLNNNATHNSAQHSPLLPPTLLTSNTSTHVNLEKRNDQSSISPTFINNSSPPSPNNEICENDVVPEHRDSGISLVPPGGRSGHHSREHSIPTIFRKCDGQRREKSWGPFSSIIIRSKDNDMELLAFRYPSAHNTDIYIDSGDFGMEEQDHSSFSGGAFISEFDGVFGKQKDKERSVTFEQVSTSDEETGLNKRKRCTAMNKNVHDIFDNIKRDSREIDNLNISPATNK